MITTYNIIQVDDKFTCINRDDDYSNIVGGVFNSSTAAFSYALKELDESHDYPCVVEFF